MITKETQFGMEITVITEDMVNITNDGIIEVDPKIIEDMNKRLAHKDKDFLKEIFEGSIKPKRMTR